MKRLLLILGIGFSVSASALTTFKECGPAIESYGAWEVTNDSGASLSFTPRSGLLYISQNERILSRSTLRRRISVFTEREQFEALAQNLKVGEANQSVVPFAPGSLDRHYAEHGIEFAILPSERGGKERYEARALAFAGNRSGSAISFTFYDEGADIEKWVKFDLSTTEIVITNARRGNLITYFKVDSERKRRMGFSGALEYVLSIYANQIQ